VEPNNEDVVRALRQLRVGDDGSDARSDELGHQDDDDAAQPSTSGCGSDEVDARTPGGGGKTLGSSAGAGVARRDGRTLGNEAYRAGDMMAALEWYTRGITERPNDHRLFTNRATALLQVRRSAYPSA
jgi:hypothetical protein